MSEITKTELERIWTDTYKKGLSRGLSAKRARQNADQAAADARAHGAEGEFRKEPRRNQRIDKIVAERAKRARAAEELGPIEPDATLSEEELRKKILKENRLLARRHAQRLTDVTPMQRLKIQNNMLKRLNENVEAQLKRRMEGPPKIPFERYLSHQEITNKVAEELAKRMAGPTQWKNWTPEQREEAIRTTRYWEDRIYDYEYGRYPEYEMREFTAEGEAKRRLSDLSLNKRIKQIQTYSMNEKGELGMSDDPNPKPIERTPYMSMKEMDRAIFDESVKWTGAKIKGAGIATGAAIKSGAKTAAGFGKRALARLGTGAIAGPAGEIAMGALTGWDVGNMIYDAARINGEKMRAAQWPLTMAGVASLAMYGNMLVNSGIAQTIDLSKSKHLQEIGMAEDEPRPFFYSGRTNVASSRTSDFQVPEIAEPAQAWTPAEVASASPPLGASRLPWAPEEPAPVAPSSEIPDEIYEGGKFTPERWNGDAPLGSGGISDWNDIASTVLGNITGQGIEGEPDQQTANEIVETWARVYESEIKKEAKEDTGIASASPGDWFGGAGWDWANQLAQDKPAEEIADAFDPWTQFNPKDQSSLEAHGADVGRGIGGSASEELKEMMAHTTFLQKIADNTKEDEIAVLGV